MGPPWKCPDCGTWWGVLPEHTCPPSATSTGTDFVIRPYVPPTADTSSTVPMHYCEACFGWHGPHCPGLTDEIRS